MKCFLLLEWNLDNRHRMALSAPSSTTAISAPKTSLACTNPIPKTTIPPGTSHPGSSLSEAIFPPSDETLKIQEIQNGVSRHQPFPMETAMADPSLTEPLENTDQQCERSTKTWRCGAKAMIGGEGLCTKHISKAIFAKIFGVIR